ncbi:MAG TPA: hypothetical protein VK157_07680 [Phycisphaerales bacterium]|nr:hypothetical protein [Phycisphaerales bacterium]
MRYLLALACVASFVLGFLSPGLGLGTFAQIMRQIGDNVRSAAASNMSPSDPNFGGLILTGVEQSLANYSFANAFAFLVLAVVQLVCLFFWRRDRMLLQEARAKGDVASGNAPPG